jgi:putative intracellular protease/amidase
MTTALLVAAAIGLYLWLGLPATLRALGLHAHYGGPHYRLPGKRALIVTTSQAVLEPSTKATGVFGSEMTAPYYAFLDAGMQVDIASIKGGPVPIEPDSFRWFLAADSDKRYLKDPVAQDKAHNALPIDSLAFADYDIVFLAGGWGAAYDLGRSKVLGDGISEAWAAGKVVGGVCHGPLGLLQASDTDGSPLVAGKRLTAVTNRQVAQLGISMTPQHPERELRAAGAVFEHASAWFEPFANRTVVDDRLVTGQNQNAGEEAAHKMLQAAGGTVSA